jgi:hypothetical protein
MLTQIQDAFNVMVYLKNECGRLASDCFVEARDIDSGDIGRTTGEIIGA